MFKLSIRFIFLSILISGFLILTPQGVGSQWDGNSTKYIILLIGDGMGSNHLLAANSYTGLKPDYQEDQTWRSAWISTFPYVGTYDPNFAWQTFDYVTKDSITDSAAAATALYTGVKTVNGRISMGASSNVRLKAITEFAREKGFAVGAVTTTPISHATPAAWIAHNDSRNNGYAIADEGLWGNPNTTGTPFDSSFYEGSHGTTMPPIDVLIGGGNPAWFTLGNHFVNSNMVTKLKQEAGQAGTFHYVERVSGKSDGGNRLLEEAQKTETTRLVGLFGGTNGDIEYRLADNSGANAENPTLPEMALAALTVLEKNPCGFILLIEGGTIDHASHANNMNEMIGEVIDFNQTVQTVVDWVEDPSNDPTWENTLVIVTADHETGYLAQAPGVFANQSLGEVSPWTVVLEKKVLPDGPVASWDDVNDNNEIEIGESVYWAWNSTGHTNSLVPIFVRGAGSERLDQFIRGVDPIRGFYLDNTDVFGLMRSALGYTEYLPIIFANAINH